MWQEKCNRSHIRCQYRNPDRKLEISTAPTADYVGSAESPKPFVQEFVVLPRPLFKQFFVLPWRSFKVRYSAETFVRRVHVRLTCVDAFFDACFEVLARRLRRPPHGPTSRLPRRPRSSSVVPSSGTFDAWIEVPARRLRRSNKRDSSTPVSRSSPVVCRALLRDLIRRLLRGPRSFSVGPSSGIFFDACPEVLARPLRRVPQGLLRRLPRGPSSSSTAPSSRTFFDACLEDLARSLRRPPQGPSSTRPRGPHLVQCWKERTTFRTLKDLCHTGKAGPPCRNILTKF